MLDTSLPRPRPRNPFLLATDGGHDGFWEIDLATGHTWFSDWFYETLGWPEDGAPRALNDLRRYVDPHIWDDLLCAIRDHLEWVSPLDLEFPVRLEDGTQRWWHIRGTAQRGEARHPTHLAGSVCDVSDQYRGAKIVRFER